MNDLLFNLPNPNVFSQIKQDSLPAFLLKNILTLGVYGTAKVISLQNLEQGIHEALNDQAAKINGCSENLEKNFSAISPPLQQKIKINKNVNASQIGYVSSQIDQLSFEKKRLFGRNLQKRGKKILETMWRVVNFIGQLIVNISSLGVYMVYQNHMLKNRIQNLKVLTLSQGQLQDRIRQLEAQIKDLNVTEIKNIKDKNQEISTLISTLGPLPSPYTLPEDQDGCCIGAMDFKENQDIKDKFAHQPDMISWANRYNALYYDQRSESEIMRICFQDVFNTLIDQSKELKMIHFNDSKDSPGTSVEFVCYCYMVWTLIQGARVSRDCHGYFIEINPHVSMYSSNAQRMISLNKDNQLVGVIHYIKHDYFTPSIDVLKFPGGIYPVEAKWILEQLNPDEKKYFMTRLMSPIIEDIHSEHQNMMRFMSDTDNPRVRLVQTLVELIQNIAVAFQFRFPSIFAQCWGEHANSEAQPFIKLERDKLEDIYLIPDDRLAQVPKDEEIVDWALDDEVLKGGNYSKQNGYDQQSFVELIRDTQKCYKQIFKFFKERGSQLLVQSKEIGEKFEEVDWETLNQQYYISHRMIGSNPEGLGGERCLFSNLLTSLVTDEAHITSRNVIYLKHAIAAYLDKLQAAKQQLSQKNPSNDADTIKKLKQKAELAYAFEKAIKNTHKCSIQVYQNWLTGNFANVIKIDVGNLTTLEIQLAAHAIGVRINVIPVLTKCSLKVDEYGRILPSVNYSYGPNTQESLTMAVSNATYYSLFPKINIANDQQLQADCDLNRIVAFWDTIKQNG